MTHSNRSFLQFQRFWAMTLALALIVGCASKSDTENLQAQIDGLKAETASVKSAADEALSAAQESEAKAAKLEAQLKAAEKRIVDFETLCKPISPAPKKR